MLRLPQLNQEVQSFFTLSHIVCIVPLACTLNE